MSSVCDSKRQKMSEIPTLENNNQERSEKDKPKPKLWKQNIYDQGTWTKALIMKDNIMHITNKQKLKESSNSWNTIVDITHHLKLTTPANIIVSIQSSLSSLTINITEKTRKKRKDKVCEYITSWDNRIIIASSTTKVISINSTLDFPALNQ